MKQVIIILLFFALVFSSSEWDTFKGSSPVIQNERVFQIAFEKVVCINIHTGDTEWISSIPAYNSTPAVSDDRIIVATNRGISAA